MLTRDTHRRALARVIEANGKPREGGHKPDAMSRRELLARSGMTAAAVALANSPALLGKLGRDTAAYADGPDNVTDTFNGLAAFIVPGPDPYSVQQGVTDAQPGGVAACTGLFMGPTLDLAGLAPPPFPGLGSFVAFILNNVAQGLYSQLHGTPEPSGPFSSPFANLSFGDKVACFAAMESGAIDPALVPLAGALPIFTAFIAYSEAGVLIPSLCTLDGVPVGWAISGYEGVRDGRDEFRGYFEGRRKAL
jgi:hypothetical protein